jgi:hypothetical protein
MPVMETGGLEVGNERPGSRKREAWKPETRGLEAGNERFGSSKRKVCKKKARAFRVLGSAVLRRTAKNYTVARRHRSRSGSNFHLRKCGFSPEQISNTRKRFHLFQSAMKLFISIFPSIKKRRFFLQASAGCPQKTQKTL